jgi:hypothetical protein
VDEVLRNDRGYNYVLPSRFLLGIEADASFMNALSADDVVWFRTTPDTDIAEKIDYMATLHPSVKELDAL